MAGVKPDEVTLKHDGKTMTASFRFGSTVYVMRGPLSNFKYRKHESCGGTYYDCSWESFELVEVREDT